MRKYQPGNTSQLNQGYLFLFLYALFGGAISGVTFFFISHSIFYLIIMSPVIAGFVNGISLEKFVYRWKVASPTFATICAILMGTSFYSVFHYADYLAFDDHTRALAAEKIGTDDFNLTSQMVDEVLFNTVGTSGFGGHLKFKADLLGLHITRKTNIFVITGVFVWLSWLIEWTIITGIGVFLVRHRASRPFSHHCQDWYLSEHAGDISGDNALQFLTLLKGGHYSQAGKFIAKTGNPRTPNLALYLGQSSCEDNEFLLTVSKVTENRIGNLKITDLVYGLLSSQEVDKLLEGVKVIEGQKAG